MARFRALPAPVGIVRDGRFVSAENEYVGWRMDLEQGGELVDARVRNGSGENLLCHPQKTSICVFENGRYHEYSTLGAPAEDLMIETGGAAPKLSFRQRLADSGRTVLQGVELEHSVVFSPWGYATHRVCFHVAKNLASVGEIRVGTFGAARRFDCCAVRPTLMECGFPEGSNLCEFKRLYHGLRREDLPAYLSRWIPVSVLMFQRGVEGIEFSLGDQLMNWDAGLPSRQTGLIQYCNEWNGYEVRMCPLLQNYGRDIPAGDRELTFRMCLPYVRPSMAPLRPAANALQKQRGFDRRWPTREELRIWGRIAGGLLRIHNDCDCFDNGIFWRDAAFPPYPPAETEKMKRFLAEARRNGISAVPYFSVKEFHPEAESYKENAAAWARCVDEGRTEFVNNWSSHGVFGTQMCLESGWLEHHKKTVDEVLSHYDFDGVYFDGSAGECFSVAHAAGRHWDNEKFQEFLEWSRQRVGEDGEVYLHVTGVPNLAAENLATMVLAEEWRYAAFSPCMFTPQVHFMNVAPRQICDMLPGDATPEMRRKLALCAILHHATISSVDPVYGEFYSAPGCGRSDGSPGTPPPMRTASRSPPGPAPRCTGTTSKPWRC